jgi:dihydrodipicolinate synthase/N-acetylneuraminate lyase
VSASIHHLSDARRAALAYLLPAGVPRLWCPLLTPYAADGHIDAERLRQHLDSLRGSVGGLLVPGSTGDGWQLSDDEVGTLLAVLLPEARERGMAVLIGLLKADTASVLRQLQATLAWLRSSTRQSDDRAAMRAAGVCGFTICPPSGVGLPQQALFAALDEVLATGLPIALYQLPQVTGNEMSAQTVAALAARHPNFLWFKDTSGEDRAAASGLRDVFLVRGAEGAYHRHLQGHGGAYDGFLLSTANVFGPALAALMNALEQGREQEAEALSRRLSAVVDPVFAAAGQLPHGNAFTNANKAIDHWMAHGPDALNTPGPRLHSGHTLPAALITLAGDALRRQGLLPERGYLA